MKLDEYREQYQEYSRQASESTRQLTLAGVAAAWLFIHGYQKPNEIPLSLFVGFMCLASSLFADVLQYTVGAVIHRGIYLYREKRTPADQRSKDVKHSEWYPRIIAAFFTAKLLLSLAGYCCLGFFVWKRVVY
jgi:hypothetical protein